MEVIQQKLAKCLKAYARLEKKSKNLAPDQFYKFEFVLDARKEKLEDLKAELVESFLLLLSKQNKDHATKETAAALLTKKRKVDGETFVL